jgi:protein-S-isoprenylcysteine O-methyltransferase Ste14
MMGRVFIIRALSLYLPLVFALLLWKLRKVTRSEATGALLATAWNLPALLTVNLIAPHYGWWNFGVKGGMLIGLPVDLWIGWAVFWGTVAALLFRNTALWMVAAGFGIADLFFMPMCAPVVMVGKKWLIGECIALCACMIPGLMLARWTRDFRNVKRRAFLQAVCFSGLLVVSIVMVADFSGELQWFTHISSINLHLLVISLLLTALPGLSAVQEFATVGLGTPLPFDPPQRLVRSGIYAYVANPMQISLALLLFVMSIAMRNLWLGLACSLSVAYSAGLATWDEERDLRQRYGQLFLEYHKQIRNWLPCWRPFISQPARIYLSEGCFKCSQMAAFLKSLRPIGLEIVAAEEHPRRNLERMTYESEAVEEAGLPALGRALEHVNFGWALLGMALRLPGISTSLQAILDVSGGERILVARKSCELSAPSATRPENF